MESPVHVAEENVHGAPEPEAVDELKMREDGEMASDNVRAAKDVENPNADIGDPPAHAESWDNDIVRQVPHTTLPPTNPDVLSVFGPAEEMPVCDPCHSLKRPGCDWGWGKPPNPWACVACRLAERPCTIAGRPAKDWSEVAEAGEKDTSHHHPAEPESPRATPAAYTGEYDESVGQTVEDARTIAMLELAAEMRGYAEDLNENARLQSELIDALAKFSDLPESLMQSMKLLSASVIDDVHRNGTEAAKDGLTIR